MKRDRGFALALAFVVLFSGVVFWKVARGRSFDFDRNTHMIEIVVRVDEEADLALEGVVGATVFRSGVPSDGRIKDIERTVDGYVVEARIPVTQAGPYRKFGSQPVKMGSPLVLEGERFYLDGRIVYIEAGEVNEDK